MTSSVLPVSLGGEAAATAGLAAGLVALAVLVLLGGSAEPGPEVGPVAAPPGRHDPAQAAAAADPAQAAGSAGAAGAARPGAPPESAKDRRAGWRARPAGLQRQQRHADDAEVSSALALLALAYRSGLPTWDVLDAVAAGLGDPAAADLRQVAAALRWGATEAEAWGSVGPTWAPAARAVAIAHQAGVPPGPMLLAASDDLRRTELERLEISAAKVGVKLVAPLGLVLLPAFCLTTVAPLVIALAGDLLHA